MQQLTENQVARQVKDYLTAKRYFWWVSKTLGVWDAKKQIYRKDKTQRKGISDLAMLHRGTYYALELKRSSGGVWSAEQQQFKRGVEANGGIYLLVRSIDDLERAGL